MCGLISLNYRLLILKSLKVASSEKQGLQYGTVRKYGTIHLNFWQEVRYTCTVRLFCNGTGTARSYGTLQELN